MRRIFWGFCRKWFLMSPLHYLSGRSDFGFELAEIFVFEKRLPAITYTGSHRLSVSVIRGVADSVYQWCGESSTPWLNDTGNRRLPVSPIRRVGYWIFLKENSLYQWYGESSTPRTSDTVSRRLPVSLSRRVTDSAYHRCGESTTPRIGDTGSRYSEKKLV
jgi:hypothetical protein